MALDPETHSVLLQEASNAFKQARKVCDDIRYIDIHHGHELDRPTVRNELHGLQDQRSLEITKLLHIVNNFDYEAGQVPHSNDRTSPEARERFYILEDALHVAGKASFAATGFHQEAMRGHRVEALTLYGSLAERIARTDPFAAIPLLIDQARTAVASHAHTPEIEVAAINGITTATMIIAQKYDPGFALRTLEMSANEHGTPDIIHGFEDGSLRPLISRLRAGALAKAET